MKTGKDVKESNDEHIDQDFENFPHAPADKKNIKPGTETEHKTADTDNKDGEKMTKKEKKNAQEENEQDSDGSGGAFEATEKVPDGDIKNKDAKTVSDH